MTNAIIIGFDTEFVRVDDSTNRILSYQYAVKTSAGMSKGIVYPKGSNVSDRIALHELIIKAIEHARREGVIGRRWPTEIYAAAHFTRADLASFKDFGAIRTSFDNVRNSYATLTAPYGVHAYDSGRNRRDLSIKLFDTMALAPNKTSLEALGKLLDIPKISLPHGAIERMDELLESDPQLFERYAIRDAEITAEHLWKMIEFVEENLGTDDPPITLGSLAVNMLMGLWAREGIDVQQVLGQHTVRQRRYDPNTGQRFAFNRSVSLATVSEHEQLATEAYHGGRNEAYRFGLTDNDFWWDVDISGAYSTAMAAIRVPDWNNLRVTRDIEDYPAETLGIARVRFEFPHDVRFPCLPVRSNNGLIFPLEGESYCASPEIALARQLGANISIMHGVVIPWLNDVRPFALFSRTVREKRKSHAKGSVFERTWKEIGNSVYGKTAQGLKAKNVYDNRSDQSQRLPPSRVTQPYLAAYITSLVRAALGEMIARVPLNKEVVSATTDGFITNQPPAEIDVSGPICTFFADQAEHLNNDRQIIEEKHLVPQVLCMKTRGQLTVGTIDTAMPVLQAKAGVQIDRSVYQNGRQHYQKRQTEDGWDYVPADLSEEIFHIERAENDELLQIFFSRHAGMKVTQKSLTPLRRLAGGDTDLVMEKRSATLNLEFDWKRELANPEIRTAGQVINAENPCHISFTTRPIKNLDTFHQVRDRFDSWRRSNSLKTEADWASWLDVRKRDDLAVVTGHRAKGTLFEQAKREWLRAYANAENGHSGGRYKEIAAALTDAGYPTTVTDLKNAKRAKPSPIDWSAEVNADIEAFMRVAGSISVT